METQFKRHQMMSFNLHLKKQNETILRPINNNNNRFSFLLLIQIIRSHPLKDAWLPTVSGVGSQPGMTARASLGQQLA